jgi:serine/threonine-protein kinase
MDLREQLQVSLGTSYTLERELGGGGMSRVFVAMEPALGRKVVVKVLSPELTHELSAERFAREVRVAAGLQHPNIVPVLSAGIATDAPFYTMPFVRGESLRARLASGPMAPADAVSVLRDVARALAYAHGENVVHRDIKPENVLLAGNAAVVTDFGIAKALSASRTAAGVTLTSAGTTLGSPAYMAPEQAAGDDVDGRADLYAWGVMAYELLAGAHPFADKTTAQQLLGAHLGEMPKPLVAPGVSPALTALVMRCLEKDPTRRPSSAGELLGTFDGLTTPAPTPGRPHARRSIMVVAVAGTVVAVGGGAAWYGMRTSRAAPGTTARAEALRSVAVLPLVNVSGDTADEYFSDGLTDELTTALSRVPALRVAARSSAYHYKGRRDVRVQDVSRELGVGSVLQGTVRRAGGRVRVSAQLADAASGAELWADVFERDAGEAFAVQAELGRAIAGALRVTLADSGAQPTHTPDPTAYDLYLRGRYLSNRGARKDIEQAIELFEHAAAKDSVFAEPHAAAATAWGLLADGYVATLDALPKAEAEARRALAIDGNNAEALAVLGQVRMSLRWDWDGARRDMEHALALVPGDANASMALGVYWGARGDFRRARALVEQAARREPFSPYYLASLFETLLALDEVDSASAVERRLEEVAPGYVYGSQIFRARNLRVHGQYREALAVDEAAAGTNGYPSEGLVADLVALGRRADAGRAFRAMEDYARHEYVAPEALASAALALGHRDHALDWLERGVEARSGWAAFTPFMFPEFARALGGDERYKRLRARMGLP